MTAEGNMANFYVRFWETNHVGQATDMGANRKSESQSPDFC